MADEETTESAEDKGGSKKKFMIIGAVVVVAAVGYFMFGGSSAPEEEMAEEEMTEVVEGEVIEIGKMTIVLADEGESLRYARIGLAVVMSELGDSGVVGTKVSLIQDAAITVISEFTSDDLRGADGANLARAKLTEEVLKIFPDGDVVRVVLTEMILQ